MLKVYGENLWRTDQILLLFFVKLTLHKITIIKRGTRKNSNLTHKVNEEATDLPVIWTLLKCGKSAAPHLFTELNFAHVSVGIVLTLLSLTVLFYKCNILFHFHIIKRLISTFCLVSPDAVSLHTTPSFPLALFHCLSFILMLFLSLPLSLSVIVWKKHGKSR